MTNFKMSDNSDSGSEENYYDKSNGKDYDVCRDFLRNVCKRGRKCKYRHPSNGEQRESANQKIVFCHDYQNTGCHRVNCKFLHCTREEEETYHSTRQLPPRLHQIVLTGNGGEGSKFDIPICKDFQKGQCVRGMKCKYRHVKNDYQQNGLAERGVENRFDDRYEEERYEGFDRYDTYSVAKRRRVELVSYPGFEDRYRPMSYHIVEEENLMLRRKVEELKKTIADLTATNEVLLEQNARYRVSKANAVQTLTGGDLAHTQLTPAVTPGGPATGNSFNMNSTLTQQISMNSDLATQHALQTAQRIASVNAAGMNVTPTINASMVPVSMTQTMVPVTMGQNNISMQNLQSGCTITRSIPQSFAAHQSNPLISYPIMSHSMRTAAV
ncbi:hypothetical protein LOTGIDRAFT_200237, partial [Lottia gigantea]